MKLACSASMLILAAAGTAQAGFFSFASDVADQSWTFTGGGAGVSDSIGPGSPLKLLIDDDNGVMPTLEVSVDFDAAIDIDYAGSVDLGGGNFSHNYHANGSFSFKEITTGITILTVEFDNQLMTALGAEFSWYTTATIQGSENPGGSVDYFWSGASLPAYGLEPGELGFNEDFAFTLTALNTDGSLPWGGAGAGVGLDDDHLPGKTWYSEGSYSGGASIPAPASLALLGAAGLLARRRRR